MKNTNIVVNTKSKYEVDGRCMVCHLNSFERLMNLKPLEYAARQHFFGTYNLTMGSGGGNSNPELYTILKREFCKITGTDDLYVDEKKQSNHAALELYKEWKPKVVDSTNPFNLALRLSIAGNIMDYGANADFNIHNTISKVVTNKFAIDHSEALELQISKAKNILYLGDNAGEIVFDKLFIETIHHSNLTFAVRGNPVLNDVTMEDAIAVGMDKVCKVISNGYDAPSTILDKCSAEFQEAYQNADLIISKGQGNFEGLYVQADPRIYFLLMVKCDVVGEMLGVEKGGIITTTVY